MIIKNIKSIEPVSKAGSNRTYSKKENSSKTIYFIPIFNDVNDYITIIDNKTYNLKFDDFKVNVLFSSKYNPLYPENTSRISYKNKMSSEISKYWKIFSSAIKLRGYIENDNIIVDLKYLDNYYTKKYNSVVL